MTTKEAIYLLRNTAWVAPSLEPVDEAIDMACKALSKAEPRTDCETCRYAGECDWEPWQECPYAPKDEQSGKE